MHLAKFQHPEQNFTDMNESQSISGNMGAPTIQGGGLGDRAKWSQSLTLSNKSSTQTGQIEPMGEVEGIEYLSENNDRETPAFIHKYNKKHPILERLDTDHKFVIFNTGDVDIYKVKLSSKRC